MSKQHSSIHVGQEEDPESIEERQRLKQVFADMEIKQIDFLDETGKSIIERVATLLAVLLAVSSFGGGFPPAYLKGNILDKSMLIFVLCCYILAMMLGIWALLPRRYDLYRHNITRMKEELDRIINHKKRWIQFAGMLFALGTFTLVALIILIIISA